jgi:hypothetical protein
MAPINNRGHIRWKIFATKIVGALRTTVGRGRRTGVSLRFTFSFAVPSNRCRRQLEAPEGLHS